MKEQIQNPEKFEIKKLTSEDSANYWEIRQEMVSTDPQAFGFDEKNENENYWKEFISKPENIFLATENNDNYISTGALAKYEEGEYFIKNVFTSELFRGKNLSQNILNQLIEEAKQKGIKKVSLWVNWGSSHDVAFNMYEKFGFKKTKEYINEDKAFGSDYMEKFL